MKQWVIFESCSNCGEEDVFVLSPAAGNTVWKCPRCGSEYNVLLECGISPDGLTIEQVENLLENYLGAPDNEDKD